MTAPDPFLGHTLDARYVVERELGRGGMGVVYLARDERVRRSVVIKVPHARFLEDEGFLERFAREIGSLTALDHPAIVKVLDVGEHQGAPFAVLQYLAGGSLKDRLSSAGLQSPEQVLAWLSAVAGALDFIHQKGVIHRDVKPGNVLFDESGHVFLADFGIAKALGSADTGLTQTGMTPGSPDYMAPEAAVGSSLGPAYDQYALAVMVFEALARSLPHAAETPLALLVRKSTTPPASLSLVAPSVPSAVAGVVMRALSQDPSSRFASCSAFAREFDAATGSAGRGATRIPRTTDGDEGARAAARGSRGSPRIAAPATLDATASSSSAPDVARHADAKRRTDGAREAPSATHGPPDERVSRMGEREKPAAHAAASARVLHGSARRRPGSAARPGGTLRTIALMVVAAAAVVGLYAVVRPKDDDAGGSVSSPSSVADPRGKDSRPVAQRKPDSARVPTESPSAAEAQPAKPPAPTASSAKPTAAAAPSDEPKPSSGDGRPLVRDADGNLGPFEGPSNNGLIGVGGGAGGAFKSRGGHRNLRAGGAGRKADEAVEDALRWLAAHQSADGGWACEGFRTWCDGKERPGGGPEGVGKATYDVGVTGLSLLAFLGAGYTTRSEGPFGKVILNGLRYLRSAQDTEGCFGSRAAGHYVYNHAIATLAMVEAFGMTGSASFKDPAQEALDFIAVARNPYFAWRYGVKPGDNDTSVTGWMMMALKSARLINNVDAKAGKPASLAIDEDAFEGIKAWIDKMTDPDYGRVGYEQRGIGPARSTELVDRFPADKSEATTAIGMLGRIFLGEDPKQSDAVKKGAVLCAKLLPKWDPSDGSIDMYYWHYATLAMFQVGGSSWTTWHASLEAAVLAHQRKDSDFCAYKGSWDAIDPWGPDGGRVYATACLALCLETPYRYERVFEALPK